MITQNLTGCPWACRRPALERRADKIVSIEGRCAKRARDKQGLALVARVSPTPANHGEHESGHDGVVDAIDNEPGKPLTGSGLFDALQESKVAHQALHRTARSRPPAFPHDSTAEPYHQGMEGDRPECHHREHY